MTYKFAKIQKAKTVGFWRGTVLAVAIFFPFGVGAAPYDMNFQQIVYTETPVMSYHAYPDDPNFVPENVFMQRADWIDYDDNIEQARLAESNVHPGFALSFAMRPTVVCRDFGCTRINDRITRTFLFNSLANMFMMNAHSRMYICEADPFTRACLQSGITFPARVGIANAVITLPRASVDQVQLSTGMSRGTIGMTFDFMVNGINAQCTPTLMEIVVPANSQATLAAQEFACGMTTDGFTNVSLLFNIDYIDLDYGILGGYYSLGLQGPTMGGGTGYALFRVEYTNSGIRIRSRARGQSGGVPGGGANFNGGMDNRGGNANLGAGRDNYNGWGGGAGWGSDSDQSEIQPGEYAVEPLEK